MGNLTHRTANSRETRSTETRMWHSGKKSFCQRKQGYFCTCACRFIFTIPWMCSNVYSVSGLVRAKFKTDNQAFNVSSTTRQLMQLRGQITPFFTTRPTFLSLERIVTTPLSLWWADWLLWGWPYPRYGHTRMHAIDPKWEFRFPHGVNKRTDGVLCHRSLGVAYTRSFMFKFGWEYPPQCMAYTAHALCMCPRFSPHYQPQLPPCLSYFLEPGATVTNKLLGQFFFC